MKRELFLILLVIIGILLWKYSMETEEFQDFVMPKPNPQPSPVAKGDPLPFAPPSTSLLAPPPGQTASVNSYPADDPAQQKANTKRIKGLLETLNGFIKREGPGLAELGDPAVKIPLQTAHADARRLNDELSVLERNPGVESTLSEMNVYDIEANLTYLQKKWRLSANSMSGVEGFQSDSRPSTVLIPSEARAPPQMWIEEAGQPLGPRPPPPLSTPPPRPDLSGAPPPYRIAPDSMNRYVPPSPDEPSMSISMFRYGKNFFATTAMVASQTRPSGTGPTPSSSTYKYKGVILDYPSLPSTGNTVNDYYILNMYANIFAWNIYALWDGSKWLIKGIPDYTIVDTVRNIEELSGLRYSDMVYGGVYKLYDKVGPYTVYLVWIGGAPGPTMDTPQDIVNMFWHVYNMAGSLYGPSPWMNTRGFTFVATTSLRSISNLIDDINKSEKNITIANNKIKVNSILELPPSNNSNNDYGVISLGSNKDLFAIWRGNCWVGQVAWEEDFSTPPPELGTNPQYPVVAPPTYRPPRVESFQNPSGTPNNPILTPELLEVLTNLLKPNRPSGNPSLNPSGNPSLNPSGRPSPGPSRLGPSPPPSSLGPPSSGASPSGLPSASGISGSASITVAQLNTLQINISATIMRLTASGSTNPLLQQRINVLETVLQNVNSYVTQINRGTLKATDIPISVANYNKFLPFVDPSKSLNINEPLPNLIVTTGANSALANLFPYLFGGDVSGTDLARSLFDKYAKNFFNNTSYEVDLKFKRMSNAEINIAENIAKAALNPLRNSYGSDSDDYYGSESRKNGSTHGTAPKTSGSRGETEERTMSLSGSTNGKTSKSHTSTSANPGSASSTPATMDWKARSEQICSQISKRGLNPNDYGCLKNPKDVDENFSFRGHARMVCSRLGTHYDPSIPDLCGCPPPTWAGWRP